MPSGRTADRSRTDPKNPRNYSLYDVKRGDSLTKIARLRNGLTAADLAWLNELNADRPLQVGQSIRLPHQQFLDAGKRARDTFLALAAYMDATGGKLPPNVVRPPSIAAQVEASGLREFRANGYRYEVDALLRTRHVSGEIRPRAQPRSRSAQANAGKPDRRSSDDGGHYIAARFNGPREWFNHFAQDANFNRGAYRALEDRWAKAIRQGKRVFIDIIPHYGGASMRPYVLSVTWTIDGEKHVKDFPNERHER
jgi:LysM repeat protein